MVDFTLKSHLTKDLDNLDSEDTSRYPLRVRCALEDLRKAARSVLSHLDERGGYVDVLNLIETIQDLMNNPDQVFQREKLDGE